MCLALPAPRTLADAWLKPSTKTTQALLILAGAALIGACAQAEIRLPFTPVPITGQTFAVLLTGMLLGWKRGALAAATYLAQGAIGLPVFAGGGAGFATLLGPTGGYLWAFPAGAALCGYLAERGWDRRPALSGLAMWLGSLAILGLGSLWLALFVGGIGPALGKGVVPFLPGDVAKVALAATALPLAWRLTRRRT